MLEVMKNDLGFVGFKSGEVKSCDIRKLKSNQLCVKITTRDGGEYILWLDSETEIAGRFYSY